jgi:transposase
MPKLLYARPASDEVEARKVRKLANSRHAPGDWIVRARIIVLSWTGLKTSQIATELGCHPQTVRERLRRFNAEGLDGLGDRPGAGRKPRLTQTERGKIIVLVSTPPPGKLVRQRGGKLAARDDQGEACWSLDALAKAAQAQGIMVKRSQVRRILVAEGVRWRQVRSWAESRGPDFVPKEQRSSRSTLTLR